MDFLLSDLHCQAWRARTTLYRSWAAPFYGQPPSCAGTRSMWCAIAFDRRNEAPRSLPWRQPKQNRALTTGCDEETVRSRDRHRYRGNGLGRAHSLAGLDTRPQGTDTAQGGLMLPSDSVGWSAPSATPDRHSGEVSLPAGVRDRVRALANAGGRGLVVHKLTAS